LQLAGGPARLGLKTAGRCDRGDAAATAPAFIGRDSQSFARTAGLLLTARFNLGDFKADEVAFCCRIPQPRCFWLKADLLDYLIGITLTGVVLVNGDLAVMAFDPVPHRFTWINEAWLADPQANLISAVQATATPLCAYGSFHFRLYTGRKGVPKAALCAPVTGEAHVLPCPHCDDVVARRPGHRALGVRTFMVSGASHSITSDAPSFFASRSRKYDRER